MNEFNKIMHMSEDSFAEWLSSNMRSEISPWMVWFDNIYCKKCESVATINEYGYYVSSPSCEIDGYCKFGIDNISYKDIILMWLKHNDEKCDHDFRASGVHITDRGKRCAVVYECCKCGEKKEGQTK